MICIGAAWAGGLLELPGGGSFGGAGGAGNVWTGGTGTGPAEDPAGIPWPEFSDTEPSGSIAEAAPELIPDYDGRDVVVLNGNRPGFTDYDREHLDSEKYSGLDALGRCGSASALLHEKMMPKTDRGEIGEIRPSGWRQKKYPGIIRSDPPYLYHRCHLIAYALTGQNANAQNLITGTCHMNMELMRPLEVEVARYLEDSGYHVLYRVTPYYKGRELTARGVEMEALSLEDHGRGVCFHVFVYNVQPGIRINYATGESAAE